MSIFFINKVSFNLLESCKIAYLYLEKWILYSGCVQSSIAIQLVLENYQIGHMEISQIQKIAHRTCKRLLANQLWDMSYEVLLFILIQKGISRPANNSMSYVYQLWDCSLFFLIQDLHQSARLLSTEMHILVVYGLIYSGTEALLDYLQISSMNWWTALNTISLG